MMDLFEKLKKHLRDRKGAYVEIYEMCGDTEAGFHDEVDFDIEKLMQEIDDFAASFEKEKTTAVHSPCKTCGYDWGMP